jgi:hypothetical protein
MVNKNWQDIITAIARNKITLKIKSSKYVNKKHIDRIDLKGIYRKYITHFIIIIDTINNKNEREFIKNKLKEIFLILKKYQGTVSIIYKTEEDNFNFKKNKLYSSIIESETNDNRNLFQKLRLIIKKNLIYNTIIYFSDSNFKENPKEPIFFPPKFNWFITDKNNFTFNTTKYKYMYIFDKNYFNNQKK